MIFTRLFLPLCGTNVGNMNRNRLIVLFLSCFLCATMVIAQEASFASPIAPSTLNATNARANHAVLHYWEEHNLDTLSLPHNETIAEQYFVDFITLLQGTSTHEEAFDALAVHLAGNSSTTQFILMLGKEYLAEPTSQVYNEQFYIMMLEALLRQESLPSTDRMRCEYELSVALKNRIGSIATDFEMLLRNGNYTHLYDIEGKYILLLFGDPDCNVCNEAKGRLLASTIIAQARSNNGLTIVSVCVEGKTSTWESTAAPDGWIDACDEMMTIYDNELYDISDIPSCYLLDSSHRVVLRDVPVSVVERYFSQQ